MHSTETAERTDRELIDSLRAFPNRVLPVGLLRELVSRGPAIHDELLRPLRMAAEDAGKGIGSLPRECFFCFGLLLAHPGVHQLPTLEALLRLRRDDLDKLLGDLATQGTLALLVGIAKADGAEETLAWMDRMMKDDSIDQWSRWPVLSTLPYLVREGILERFAATDRLIGVLRRRESCKQDLLSAASVIELSNLGATELESYVIECFERGQIDEDLYCRDDWNHECDEGTSPQARLEALPELKFDIIEILESWYGFSKISNSLNPWRL